MRPPRTEDSHLQVTRRAGRTRRGRGRVSGHARSDFGESNRGGIHFPLRHRIRSCARNHRNSLSRVIQNVAESHQALMARHRTSASGESTENCIRISYSLYLPCRTGPSTNISLREVIPTLPNSWPDLADAQDVKDAAVLVGALRALGIDCANLAPRRSKLGSSSFVEPGCGSTTGFCLAGAPFFSVGM